jgi:ankyrin repeat protein
LELTPEERLRDAIMGQDLGEIAEILAKNPTLNENWQDTGGRTFAMLAAATGDPEVVRMILDAFPEMDLTATDKARKTALEYAVGRAVDLIQVEIRARASGGSGEDGEA